VVARVICLPLEETMVLEKAGETGKFVRVLLVEDYEPWRRSIRSMLQNVSGVQVIGEVPDGLAAV